MSKKTVGAEKSSVLKADLPDNGSSLAKELSAARPSDISQRKDITRKKLLRAVLGRTIRYTAMLLCILVFIAAAGYVADYIKQYIEKEQINTSIIEGKITTKYASLASKSTGDTATSRLGQTMTDIDIGQITIDNNGSYNEYFEKKRAGFIGLQRMYPDVWGWIDVPGTKVNYIVMQGRSNTEYLYLEYNGTYTRYGSIFADFRNSRSVLANRNTILYGHNMNTAHIMFAPLLEFVTDEKAFRNQDVNIITQDGVYVFELFSVYDTNAEYDYIKTDFEDDREFIDFCKLCQKKSYYNKNIDFDKYFEDPNTPRCMLTLSTCTVRQDGKRWAFHAILKGVSN